MSLQRLFLATSLKELLFAFDRNIISCLQDSIISSPLQKFSHTVELGILMIVRYYVFEKCNTKDRSLCPRRSYDPLNLPHDRFQYSLSKLSSFDQLLPCLVVHVPEVTQMEQNLENVVHRMCEA